MTPGVHHILFYEYVDDMAERRPAHREAHLAVIRQWKADGRLVAAGVLGDTAQGAAIVFRVEDPDAVAAFVDADPYVAAGLVTRWRVERWTVVV